MEYQPALAGTISSSGVFQTIPQDYVGYVRAFAEAAGIAGETISNGSAAARIKCQIYDTAQITPDYSCYL